MLYSDIYLKNEYGKLYEEVEQGEFVSYCYRSAEGEVKHNFIKRKIGITINGASYYDLITPYGYGGPTIMALYGCKEKLVSGFKRDFKDYCKDNNVVSEFIRFHPINKNYQDFNEVYKVSYLRATVITNLKAHEDPFQVEFKKGARKEVRRALRSGVTYKVYKNPKCLTKFKELYYSTMDRAGAEGYYFFSEQYFEDILNNLNDDILVIELVRNEQVIASALYFIKGKVIHVHLLGHDVEYRHLNANSILEYAVCMWGKEHGYDYIHHGAGLTNDPEDALLKNKQKFGQNEEGGFYLGEKIWNDKVYKELCALEKVDSNKNLGFFPAYRFNEVRK